MERRGEAPDTSDGIRKTVLTEAYPLSPGNLLVVML
jgi:hypothetical protein